MLQEDRSMIPPRFSDMEKWVSFRKFMNTKLKLKDVIQSKVFRLIVIVIIVWTFVNSFLNLYTNIEAFNVIENFLIGAFIIEIILKIIGFGP
jgi:hypothetical protein